MVASLLIIAVSGVLLVYWFRYTCLLLLRSQERASEEIIRVNGLSFGEVEPRLKDADASALDPLHRSLERDYALLTYLLQHAPGLSEKSLEQRVLVMDYRIMQVWYALCRTAAPAQARKALAEMVQILRFLAYEMDQRAASRSRA